MSKDLDILLDKCIDRMNEGDSLEECLASYPEQAKELEPLLRAVWDVRDACSPMPRASAKSVVRRRLDAALVNSDRRLQERQRRTMPLFAWPRVLATVTAIFVLALMGFGLYWILTPDVAPVVAQANFRLLLSDEENAIGDFASVNVTITSIGMLRGGEGGGWEVIELDEPSVVDLTRLQGLNAQEIWNGILPEGQYRKVFIYVEDAIGTLKDGKTVNVIVPGNLQISKPFAITADDSLVNFVYDITILIAGNEYILLPDVTHSGSHNPFHEVGEGELTIQVFPEGEEPSWEGELTPGDNVTVLVTFAGDNVTAALVMVEDVGDFRTGGDGLTDPFIVPYADELEIEAVWQGLEGELEIDLEQESEEGELIIQVVDTLTLQVIDDDDVTPGDNVTVLVTFAGDNVTAALVMVEDVGDFRTGGDGRTDPFIVPYADELEIEAVWQGLEGELEIDLEWESEEGELTLQVIDALTLQAIDDDDVTPGDSVTVLVTFAGDNVTGALVKVEDVGDFRTGGDGLTEPFFVPIDDELDIEAVWQGLEGELEIDLEKELQEGEVKVESQGELEGELNLDIEGDIAPGGTVTLLVTFEGQRVAEAEVEVNDEEIGSTEQDGTITFTIPEDADELDIEVKKGKLKGDLEIELQEGEVKVESQGELEGELNLDIEGDIAPGGIVTLLVTFEGQRVAEAEVEVNDEEIGSTEQDGTITFTIPEDADELDIEVKKGKLKGDLEIELQEAS